MTGLDALGLTITVHQQGTTTTIELSGEFDIAQEQPVSEALRQMRAGEPEYVVLDLTKVNFIDSTAIGVVVGLNKWAKSTQTRLVVCHGTPAVRRVFDLTGLSSQLPFVESLSLGPRTSK